MPSNQRYTTSVCGKARRRRFQIRTSTTTIPNGTATSALCCKLSIGTSNPFASQTCSSSAHDFHDDDDDDDGADDDDDGPAGPAAGPTRRPSKDRPAAVQ